MKVLVDLQNVNGTTADILDCNGTLLAVSICLNSIPEEYKESSEVSTGKLIKLKDAGFDADEILKMNEKGMI